MGLFNSVYIPWQNTRTNAVITIEVQFKYAECWQHGYNVGNTLRWTCDDNDSPHSKRLDIGRKDNKRVVIEGAAVGPPEVPAVFEVHVVDGKIDRVIPDTGAFDWSASNYYILDLGTPIPGPESD